jgi:hypothetical protein
VQTLKTRGGRADWRPADFEVSRWTSRPEAKQRCRASSGSAAGVTNRWTSRGAAKRTPTDCRLLSSSWPSLFLSPRPHSRPW